MRKICSTDWKAEPGSKFGTLAGNYFSSVINLFKSVIIPARSMDWKLSPSVSLWSFEREFAGYLPLSSGGSEFVDPSQASPFHRPLPGAASFLQLVCGFLPFI